MVNANADKDYGIDEFTSTSELPENKLRHNFRLGDITWVKKSDSSWWPAQVIDEACVGGKPKKKTKHDCLVRLYGTCQYLCIDPWKSNTEFKMMLKQQNKSAMEAFREVLEKELSSANSSSDYDEEGVNSKALPAQDIIARVNKLFSFGVPECDILPYSHENPRPDAPVFRQEHILSIEVFDLDGTYSADAVDKGKGSTNEEAEGSLRSKRLSSCSQLLSDSSPLKRKRRSPQGTTSVPAQSPLRATVALDDPVEKGTSGTSSQPPTRGTIMPDDSIREAIDDLALLGPYVTSPPAPLTGPRTKKVTSKRQKPRIISHFPISNRLSTEAQTKAASALTSHLGLPSPVDLASGPIRDPASSAPEEDSELRGSETSIPIPTDDPWAAIKALLQATSAQVAAAEANHHKKLEAKREKIERLESSCNSKEKLLAVAMKKINDDVKFRERLRNQANTARAKKKAMMAERDAAVLALQELKEQTLDLMSQAASASAATLLGGDTEVTTKKNSSRKDRKREGLAQCSYRGLKESATTEDLGDETEQQYNEDQDQEVGSTATTGVTVQKGKRGCARQSSCTHEQAIDRASSENSAEGLRNKKRKQIACMLDKDDCKIGASVVRREGLRRSGRTNENKHLDPAEDRTAPITEIGASEDATEDSTGDGTSAPHAEIKALVRDILFKEIIDREHNAEMAYLDDVINGICNATEDDVTGGATASTKGGQSVRQSGSRVEGESSNVTRRHRKEKLHQGTEDTMQVDHTTPGCSDEATGNT
ncbi:uncharacterized protein LOC133898410 isoform X2 [Phragmites australis]|uniref:uncharacterized protein LOC133898410 isoform X2 n=1 Tax=Phragmites australis TaxID=29695 RepID=UPI002D78708E|nr:uncharacterized protein LOC133898410 isoform X2 [Phragmites australis]